MPVRNVEDLACVHSPKKYRIVGDFPAYYRGERRFPWPVYFIGGNHEPYGFLHEHEEEAEKAGCALISENVHYLGRVGWAQPFGVLVLGMSGIFGSGSHTRERPAKPTRDNARAFTYFHQEDLAKVYYTFDSLFSNYTDAVDILLLHDWPAGMIPKEEMSRMDQKYGNMAGNAFPNWAESTFRGLQSRFICCGHHHVARRYRYGSSSEIVCLADMTQGFEAVQIFRKREGRVERVECKSVS